MSVGGHLIVKNKNAQNLFYLLNLDLGGIPWRTEIKYNAYALL